jgi:hypothetical protein
MVGYNVSDLQSPFFKAATQLQAIYYSGNKGMKNPFYCDSFSANTQLKQV